MWYKHSLYVYTFIYIRVVTCPVTDDLVLSLSHPPPHSYPRSPSPYINPLLMRADVYISSVKWQLEMM